MSDITLTILKIVISVCAALITVYLIPYLRTLRNDKRYASLIDMVEVAVRAAEQTIGSGKGELKKSEVLSYAVKWMNEHGIEIEHDQLNQLIECAVYQMKQGA